MVLEQAARALRDQQLLEALKNMQDRNERQLNVAKDPHQAGGSADIARPTGEVAHSLGRCAH
jgi:hypothetical protein